MRRILFIIVFALIITAAGCTRDNKIDELNPAKTESGSNLAEEGTTDENDTDEKTSEENIFEENNSEENNMEERYPTDEKSGLSNDSPIQYSISSNEYTAKDGNILIKYPSLSGLGNEYDGQKINDMIREEATAYLRLIGEDIDNLQMYEINYVVKFSGSKLLSIAYDGLANYEGAAHPINVFYSTNIDLENIKKLSLSDMIGDIEALADLYMSALAEEHDDEVMKAACDHIYQMNTRDDIVNGLKEADNAYGSGLNIFTYYSKEGMGISWGVPFALGDHVEIEIPYEKLDNIIDIEKIE